MDAAPSAEERQIWSGSPSQWLNFQAFLLGGIVALLIAAAMVVVSSARPEDLGGLKTQELGALALLLVVDALILLKRYLDVRYRVYEISNQRVRLTRGILSRRTDGLELYRVDDTLLFQPFLLRLIGKGNIQLVTSDRTNPIMLIEAIPQPRWLWDQLRHAVEACRDRKATRVVDFERNTIVPETQ